LSQTLAGPDAAPGPSVDPAEIARFAAMADEWWDPSGKFKPLHKFNPVRLGYIRDRIAQHFGRDPLAAKPLAGLRLLDIGCGGGLIAEPMARLGATVVAIDASAKNIGIASNHAARMGLAIDYRHATAEDLVAAGEQFDAVLSLEVVEHVADVNGFLGSCGALVRPGGALVVATLNRTPKAFLLAIVGAEYVLGWLPRGTHEWKKFVRPGEIADALRAPGLAVTHMTGVAFNPVLDTWRLARDLDVNYMAFAVKA
jgi:2-polyprenyl-6-hydroxyphenyl methylase/3-demethylubiquinone-9 3-methyltransferase